MIYNKILHTPIYTGTPDEPPVNRPRESAGSDNTFRELLEQKIKEESQVSFSEHAIKCVVEREVNISPERIERLNGRIRMAEEKGLEEPLILLGPTAFVVDVKNNKVVTVIDEDSLKGTVSTNIDGTVMIQPVLLKAILTPSDGRVGQLEKEN